MSKSVLEEGLASQIKLARLPKPKREYKFCDTRRFRADFAWPKKKLIVEVQGGIWNRGRHTTGAGYQKDCERYNIATEEGWRILMYTNKEIKNGTAVKQIKRVLCQN